MKCIKCSGTYQTSCPVFDRFKDETSEVHYFCPSCMPFTGVNYVPFKDVGELILTRSSCLECPLYGKCLTFYEREEPKHLQVTVNLQDYGQGYDYEVAGNTLTFFQELHPGDEVHVQYRESSFLHVGARYLIPNKTSELVIDFL